MTAIIFDCDGVLAETERDGHRIAFNLAFERFGLGMRWDPETYGTLLSIGGGKERLRAALSTERDRGALGAYDDAGIDRLVADLHAAKTELFVNLAERGELPARPGIARIVDAALEAGWTLAVASTSAERSVRSVLASAVGPRATARFGGVFAGDVVTHKKPAPDIYLHACASLGLRPGDAVVIEDSALGAASASAAGLGHLVTVSQYSRNEAFPDAAAVVTSLGDMGEPSRCLAHARVPATGELVTLDDLDRCAAAVPVTTPVDD